MSRWSDTPPDPVEAPLQAPANRLTESFRSFVDSQSGSGWLLLAATAMALFMANSPWAAHYFEAREVAFGLALSDSSWRMSLEHWVNDGLMALFFLLLGLELKREFLVGQLSQPGQAASVLAAALGGMLIPAILFLSLVTEGSARQAWAIPMATDTAFALMILVFLRDRVPLAARAFLVGLAIVDDLGAILVIAFFYTSELHTEYLPAALMVLLALTLLNLSGVRRGWMYVVAGVCLWLAFLAVGLHGTLAGVVVALFAPVKPAISRSRFARLAGRWLSGFERAHDPDAETILEAPDQHASAQEVLQAARDATVPLKRWEHKLETPVSYLVIPVFAFVNAGVAIDAEAFTLAWQHELSAGILLGLLLGKPIGILAGVGVGHLTGFAAPPAGLSRWHLLGLGLLGGIGFTMSLFISSLSFDDRALLDIAKQAIMATSLIAGICGYLVLRFSPQKKESGS
jgi:NhaA family Na+:H+ antiporter